MPKYEVVNPWFGVKKGDLLESVGEMFLPNVRLVTANSSNEDSEDLKKEITALKSKVTKAENALSAKDEEIKSLKAGIEALKAK